jgi:hypothetical protein
MDERSGKPKGDDPHETYGVQRVPKSRADALGQIKADLQREMARRAGGYGSRLTELMGGLEASEAAFQRGLETLLESAVERFGPQAARWSWGEVVGQVATLSPQGLGPLEPVVRTVEDAAERHEDLRAKLEAARQVLIIHREAMGFRRHHLVEES